MTTPQAPAIVGRVGTMSVRSGRYFDGDESYQRMTNTLKGIETDTFNLDEWRENMLAIGLSARPDLVLGVAAAAQFDPLTGKLTSEAKSTLRGLRKQAEQAAKSKAGANQGTAVHTATERLDLGETVEQIGLPHPFNLDLAAYAATIGALRLTYRPEHIERTVRLRAFGVAGSYDRLGTCGLLVDMGLLEPDELLVVDVKTEGDPLRNLMHIAPQLSGYANADDVFVPEPQPATDADPHGPYRGRYEPMPKVSKRFGLMIHVRDGRATPYLLDLERGWRQVQRAIEQRDELAASKIKLGEPGCWAALVPIDLPRPPAAEVAAAAAVHASARGGQHCLTCRKPVTPGRAHTCSTGTLELPVAEPMALPSAEQVYEATARPDGMTEWRPIPDGPQPLEAMLWEAIMVADSVAELSGLFERATATGVAWEGPIAEAGIKRAAIVQCVQRELHTGAGACACGWSGGMAS